MCLREVLNSRRSRFSGPSSGLKAGLYTRSEIEDQLFAEIDLSLPDQENSVATIDRGRHEAVT